MKITMHNFDFFNTYEISDFTPLSYNFLKSQLCGDAVIDAAVKRWENTGLVGKKIGHTKKEELSVAYDNIAYLILTESEGLLNAGNKIENNLYSDFGVVVFPLVNRIVLATENFDIYEFINLLDKYSFITINEDDLEDYPSDFDVEAEYVSLLAKVIAFDFNESAKNNDEDTEL